MKHLQDRFKLNAEQICRLKIALKTLAKPALVIIALVGLKITTGVGYVCPVYKITGLYCPGCGGTRMFIELLKLNIKQAFRYNCVMCISLPVIAVIVIQQAIRFVYKGNISKWVDSLLITFAIILIIFGFVRNLEIFRWLIPTEI